VFLLCSPCNPSGAVFPGDDLIRLARWCRRHKIWLLSDEIYATSCVTEANYDVKDDYYCHAEKSRPNDSRPDSDSAGNHDGKEDGCAVTPIEFTGPPFQSLVRIADVTMWGLSKDFGASGFRMGALHVKDAKNLKPTLMKFIKYFLQPSQGSVVLSEILADPDWVGSYLQTLRTRAAQARDFLCHGLRQLGLPMRLEESNSSGGPSSGLFVFVDFREFGILSFDLFLKMLREYGVH
jgi:aspartate/methionine/tyrosine aminotransferase